MRMWTLGAAALAASVLAMPAAAATTVTFDDIVAGDNTPVPALYMGLNWDNFGVVRAADRPQSGYPNMVRSAPNVAFNSFGDPATISGNGFTLISGYFGSAWRDGMTVNVLGFVNGVQAYSTSFLVTTALSTLQEFNWANLSAVTFSATGGQQHPGYGGTGTSIAFDNLTFDVPNPVTPVAPVPEPASWALMLLGFGAVAMTVRRRRVSYRLPRTA